MMLWLLRCNEYFNRYDHKNQFNMMLCAVMRQERIDAREYLSTLPFGPELLSKERPQRTDEPEEPHGMP